MSQTNPPRLSLTLLLAMVLGLSSMALPALAQTQGSSSAGQTASQNARALKGPQPTTGLVVTAVDSEQGKIKLRSNNQGWEHWFEMTDETVIRSAADKQRVLSLTDIQVGKKAEVFVAHKLLGGKTVYLTVEDG